MKRTEPPSQPPPFVTVVIRSYRRIPAMLELLAACRAQEYPAFEILVVEQTGPERETHRAALDAAQVDPRVRVLEVPPLGPAGARNRALLEARGEVLLFMDDDDLPVGTGWLSAHARHFADPLCLGVSGRQVSTLTEDPTPHNTEANRRLCLRFTWFKMPRARVRHTQPVRDVDLVTGGNGSYRREAVQRAGGWDEHWFGEEYSVLFRLLRVRRAGEYYAYEPEAVMLRRLDIGGGSERRLIPPAAVLRENLGYSHFVVGRYCRLRFRLCYPAYLVLAFVRADDHLQRFSVAATSRWTRWTALLAAYPATLAEVRASARALAWRPIPEAAAPRGD